MRQRDRAKITHLFRIRNKHSHLQKVNHLNVRAISFICPCNYDSLLFKFIFSLQFKTIVVILLDGGAEDEIVDNEHQFHQHHHHHHHHKKHQKKLILSN